jgi:hypothetical protein
MLSEPFRSRRVPLRRISFCKFARLNAAVSRVLPQLRDVILPASAKGMPNPVAFGDISAMSDASLLRDQHTHETPVSQGEESGVRIERYVGAWAFGVMEWTGSLDLGGRKSPAGDMGRGQSGSVCGLAKHLNGQSICVWKTRVWNMPCRSSSEGSSWWVELNGGWNYHM